MTSALHPLLRGRVLAIDVVESSGAQVVLPSTSVVLGMQFVGRVRAGETSLSTAGVTGVQDRARTYSYGERAGSVLVRFTPLGASCLGVPVSDLSNRSIPLDAMIPPAAVAEASERLQGAATDEARVAVVEELLLRLPHRADAMVSHAVRRFDHGHASVAAVAGELGVSERQLERRFLAAIGVTPKRYASLRRFERALALARSARSLTEVALDAGYYDQSHFIRDFRRFAGAAPGAVFVSGSYNSQTR